MDIHREKVGFNILTKARGWACYSVFCWFFLSEYVHTGFFNIAFSNTSIQNFDDKMIFNRLRFCYICGISQNIVVCVFGEYYLHVNYCSQETICSVILYQRSPDRTLVVAPLQFSVLVLRFILKTFSNTRQTQLTPFYGLVSII